jgi:hypothetical protein
MLARPPAATPPACTKHWYGLDGRMHRAHPSSPAAWSRKYLPNDPSESSDWPGPNLSDIMLVSGTDGTAGTLRAGSARVRLSRTGQPGAVRATSQRGLAKQSRRAQALEAAGSSGPPPPRTFPGRDPSCPRNCRIPAIPTTGLARPIPVIQMLRDRIGFVSERAGISPPCPNGRYQVNCPKQAGHSTAWA